MGLKKKDLFHFKLSLKYMIKRTIKPNQLSLILLSNKFRNRCKHLQARARSISLEIDVNISRQEQEVLSSSNSVEISDCELDLVVDHCSSGNSSGTKLTRKTSGRIIGTYHFVEFVTVFFISFKLPVMNCQPSGGVQTMHRQSREHRKCLYENKTKVKNQVAPPSLSLCADLLMTPF